MSWAAAGAPPPPVTRPWARSSVWLSASPLVSAVGERFGKLRGHGFRERDQRRRTLAAQRLRQQGGLRDRSGHQQHGRADCGRLVHRAGALAHDRVGGADMQQRLRRGDHALHAHPVRQDVRHAGDAEQLLRIAHRQQHQLQVRVRVAAQRLDGAEQPGEHAVAELLAEGESARGVEHRIGASLGSPSCRRASALLGSSSVSRKGPVCTTLPATQSSSAGRPTRGAYGQITASICTRNGPVHEQLVAHRGAWPA